MNTLQQSVQIINEKPQAPIVNVAAQKNIQSKAAPNTFSQKIKSMTFAEALSKATMQPQFIRNVNIMGDKETTNKIYQQLRRDDMLSDIPFADIKTKGPANITLKCTTAENANLISRKLTDKYGDALRIKTVQHQRPMIKIPKLFTNETSKDIIPAQLIEQNPILNGVKIDIDILRNNNI